MRFNRDPVIGFYDIVSNLPNTLADYLELDDRVIYRCSRLRLLLDDWQRECWEKSGNLVSRLHERRLYKLIGRHIISDNSRLSIPETMNYILKNFEDSKDPEKSIKEQDLEKVVRFQLVIFYFD